MKKQFVLNKFLFILIISLLVILNFSNSVFASSFVDNSGNSVSYTLPSDCGDNFLLCSWDNGEKIILYDPVNDCGYWKITKTESISGVVAYDIQLFSDDTYTTNVGYTRKTLKNSYDFSDTNEDIYYVKEDYTSYTCVFSVDYGTCNVLNTDGTIFFQEPPTLVKVMVREQEKQTIQQEIVSLVPLIIVVVVSFLGLRKALRMLLTLLRQS